MAHKNPSILKSEFRDRVRRTAKSMEAEGLDFLVAFSCYPEREGHLEYLVNYHSAFPTSQHDEIYKGFGYSALVLSRDGSTTLCPGLLLATCDLVGVDEIKVAEDLPLSISKCVLRSLKHGRKKTATVGIAGADSFPYSYLEELEQYLSAKSQPQGVIFKDAQELILEQRASKSGAEQLVMRRGAEIADLGIQAAFDATCVGARESEIGLAAAKVCYEEGVDYVARTRIYGRNISGVRWPIMTNRRLEQGEITGIDLIGYLNGYGFDVLRLWTVGQPSAEQKEFLADAARLTEGVTKKVRAGMSGDDVSEATHQVGKELGFGKDRFASPFGHAIGLEVVENPILLPKSSKKIAKGAFLCIEPSLEMKKQSVHFEDEILIGQNGRAETITKCPKDLNS